VADALGLHTQRVQPGDHVVAGRHHDVVEIRCIAEAAARIGDERRVGAVVEEHVALGMTDQVEEVRRVDDRPAVGVERVEHRAQRLLATAVEGVHLHLLVLLSGSALRPMVRLVLLIAE